MVALGETVLAVFAYVTTIVATMRAGSRALYLREHEHIGVMEGPLILGPKDVRSRRKKHRGTEDIGSLVSPFWEVAFLFEQSVRLALDSDADTETLIDERILALLDPKKGEDTAPYSLSPYPAIEHKMNENKTVLQMEDMDVEAIEFYAVMDELISRESSAGLWGRMKERMPRLPNLSLGSRFQGVRSTYLAGQKFLTRPVRRLWSRSGETDTTEEEEDSWIDEEEEEWDYATCLSSEMSYNTTATTRRYARISAYAPRAFADLRSRFSIDESDFLRSIFDSGPFVSFQSNSKGAARVGGIFFFTRDGAYMIKSIKKEEARTLMSMLPKYHKFMKRNSRRSLLTRFCGMYGVRIGDSPQSAERSLLSNIADMFRRSDDEEHIFVVMNSVFPAEASQFLSERFDLKGSTVGRECSEEEREKQGSNAVLKDLDLAREVELVRSLATSPSPVPEYGFHIGATAKSALLSQLRRDVRLLVDCNVMDYSLLVGVVNMDSHHIDVTSIELLERSQEQESRMVLRGQRYGKKKELDHILLSTIAAPVRILMAPPLFFYRRAFSMAEATLSTVLTLPLPYYGAGICGVNGGALSVIQGKRTGNRAIYYMGLIDFLQPWTSRKVLERQMKGLMGYDKKAISCVDPEAYASRFLDFIDAHLS